MNQWLGRVADNVRATWSTAKPLNLKLRQGRLEIRRKLLQQQSCEQVE
jgi:hypothetical protein